MTNRLVIGMIADVGCTCMTGVSVDARPFMSPGRCGRVTRCHTMTLPLQITAVAIISTP